ncbi:hypothetical protein ACIHEJ_01915 [Streptomyces sp. NPDC052301]
MPLPGLRAAAPTKSPLPGPVREAMERYEQEHGSIKAARILDAGLWEAA